ncbi:MAG: 50S ribosomal protein L22 [Bacteroidales bacterium]|jgi:large subunit ribosomal protein L22|nr:50S ribosomal protein L22 [Bacteroidales bacterium]MDI9575477.1 50S ribosomal protein L22 [Bacteroidota bacterium]MDD3755077.1 50S ribosomal protein L22 [Bacteroidales bacterium]MDY0400432.1 50S ribosomal protein L22 [Bacteroidales bacterium]HHW60241.1 50S ribosomal protein L22 [Bacteroidales bacterium]
MGKRKRLMAEEIKNKKSQTYFAKLNKCPMSARKMRPIANLVRGKSIEDALVILKTTPKKGARFLYKLLLHNIDNYKQKSKSGLRIEEAQLYIKTLMVNQGPALKRYRPAARGSAHPIRKESCHIYMELASRVEEMSANINNSEVESFNNTEV